MPTKKELKRRIKSLERSNKYLRKKVRKLQYDAMPDWMKMTRSTDTPLLNTFQRKYTFGDYPKEPVHKLTWGWSSDDGLLGDVFKVPSEIVSIRSMTPLTPLEELVNDHLVQIEEQHEEVRLEEKPEPEGKTDPKIGI